MVITQEELDRTYSDLKGRHGGVKNDYFALLYLAADLKVPLDDIADHVAFGGYDFGFDAFHFDRERRNLYLYQFKWSPSYQGFKDSLDRLITAGMERVFGNPRQVQDQNDVLLQLKGCLLENKAIIDRVMIQFVFNGELEAAQRSSTLTALREDLEKKKHLLDSFFAPRDVTLSFEFRSNQTRTRKVPLPPKTHKYTVDFPQHVFASGAREQVLHVGTMSLLDLHSMYLDLGHRLFDRNIRAGLTGDRPVNRAIRSALERIVKGDADASDFVFHHNGVTIYAEHVELADGRATITEPRILNGAQTITSTATFVEQIDGNKLLKENRDRLAAVRVLAKIVSRCGDADFITTVTINTNRQNPVDPANLRANDRIQLDLQDKFRDELGIFYERQEDSFKAYKDDELEEMGINQYRAVKIKLLAQTFLAAQGEIDKMSRLGDVFEHDSTYKKTFKNGYVQTDAGRILLAYKVQIQLRRIVQEIVDKGHEKYGYLSRARNLVWALLVQGLLNDPKADVLLERYGTKLVLEDAFKEHMKMIASSKIRFIVKEAFAEERYQEAIQEEKYGFLRTNAAYDRCMEIAAEKYRWKKISL